MCHIDVNCIRREKDQEEELKTHKVSFIAHQQKGFPFHIEMATWPKALETNFFHSFFFSKIFPSLVLRKALEGYKMHSQRVLFTKEIVRARNMGDDISRSVLERRP